MNIKINTLDLSFQTRFGLNDETVAEYAELLQDGVIFPPVEVYDISGACRHWSGADHVRCWP